LFGTTGEGAALGLPARDRMLGALAGAGVEPGRQLYAGVSAAALHDALDQARIALDVGAKGLLVAPPFYFKGVSDEGLYAWFAQFIEKLKGQARGIILYHIPSMTAVEISVSLVERLKRAFPGVIAGVKDSSCHWPTTEAFLKAHAQDLAILVGDETLLGRAVREGGEGSICGVANLVPGWLRPLVYEGREDARINALVAEICRYPVMAAVKALVGHLHGDPGFGPMRAPLLPLPEADRAKLVAAFDQIAAARAA
jgi:4-hydroxy-tetrahydrodipicolinate synthase